MASGSNNEKFNGDYGTSGGTLTSPAASVAIDKTDTTDPITIGNNETYNIKITNTSPTVAYGNPVLGMPATITEVIPSNVTYASGATTGTVTTTGLGTNVGIAVTPTFSNDGLTWYASAGSVPTKVNFVRWTLNSPLPVGASLQVSLSVTANSGSIINNTAYVGLGGGRDASDTEPTLLNGVYSISGLVFNDDGTGQTPTIYYAGDGILQGTETGRIQSIDVTLYMDANNNGIRDAADISRGTLLSAANGTYSFPNLPAGTYFVVVDRNDPDRGTGYAVSTVDSYTVTLTNAGVTDRNFGFAPTVDVTKTVNGPGTVLEGTNVQYNIDIANLLKGADWNIPTTTSGIYWVDGTTNSNVMKSIPLTGTSPRTVSNTTLGTTAPTVFAFDNTNNKIYYGYSNGVLERRDLNGTNPVTLATDSSSGGITGIDVDPVGRFVYWTTGRLVRRLSMDSTFPVTLGTGNTICDTAASKDVITAAAIDPAGDRVYWTQNDSITVKIYVTTLSGGVQPVIDTKLANSNAGVTDIDIDHRTRKIYFTDNATSDNSDMIGVVNSDGTNPLILVKGSDASTPVKDPLGLDIDMVNNRVYWSQGSVIKSMALDGTDVRTVTATLSSAPKSLEIPEIVTTSSGSGLYDANKTLTVVPLTDTFSTTYFTFVSASITPDNSVANINSTGTITWSNVGPINPAITKTITVTLKAKSFDNNATVNASSATRNTASVSNTYLANGVAAGSDTSYVDVAITATRIIGDQVWEERNTNNSYQAGVDAGIPNLTVELRDSSNPDILVARTITDNTGYYKFEGVSTAGSYIVHVLFNGSNTLPTGWSSVSYPTGGSETQAPVAVGDCRQHRHRFWLRPYITRHC